MISIVLFDSCRTKTETVEQNATFFLSKLIEINVFSHSNDRVANKGKNPSRRNHCHLIKTGHKRFISALEWLNLKFFFFINYNVQRSFINNKNCWFWNLFTKTQHPMEHKMFLFHFFWHDWRFDVVQKNKWLFHSNLSLFLLSLHLFYQQIHWLLINEGNHLKQ